MLNFEWSKQPAVTRVVRNALFLTLLYFKIFTFKLNYPWKIHIEFTFTGNSFSFNDRSITSGCFIVRQTPESASQEPEVLELKKAFGAEHQPHFFFAGSRWF
jgi:hypothetical protein